MIKKYINYTGERSISLVLVIIMLLLPAFILQGQDRPLIHSASEIKYPPYSITNDLGKADGFSVQLLKEALDVMGYDVTFDVGIWQEVKSDLEFGRVDVLPLVGRTPERENIFDFTFPYLTMHGAIVAREDTNNIRDIEDLRDKKVAVMSGDNAHEYILRTIPESDIITTENFSQALLLVVNGEADAVVLQRLVALQLIDKLGVENLRLVGPPINDFNQSFSFAVQEGNRQLLEILNEGLAIVIANGTYDKLSANWLGPDQQFTHAYDRIIVGGIKDYPPYEYLDENGEPAGFSVELTRAIADEIGIEVEIVLDEWSHTYRNLLSGRIDMVQSMFYSLDRDTYLDFSQPHSIASHVIVTRKGEYESLETLEDLRGLDIFVLQNEIMHDKVIELGLDDTVTPIDSHKEIVTRLSQGEADCALLAQQPAHYYIEHLGYDSLQIGDTLFTSDFGYGALDSREGNLLLKFSDSLTTLRDNGVYRELHNKWFGVHESDLSALEIFKTFAYIIIPIGLLVLLVLLWSQMLRKKVKQKTVELEHEVALNRDAQKQIAAQFEELNITLRSIGDGVITTDTQGHIELVNRVAEQLTGWSLQEAKGRELLEVFHIIHENTGKVMKNPVTQVLETGGSIELENYTILVNRDGSRYNIADSAAPIKDEDSTIVGVVLVFRDITEDIRIQEGMQRAAKLKSVGVLAGGIAHDFNNMLSGIFGYTQLAMDLTSEDNPVREYLQEVLGISESAKGLTRQLLTFSKGGTPKRETRDMKKIIEDSVSFSLSGSHTTCTYELDEMLWPCNVDENQIGQVISNLVINALQAMPEGGELTISAQNRELFDENAYLLQPGFYVDIAVTDTGVGISRDIQPRIFDPFFTTKHEGHGLGLATCYSIINKHEGAITVESEPGEGTTFHILLPRSQAPERAEPGEFFLVGKPFTGAGTILIMDDERSICEVLGHMLRSMGFSVIVKTNGHQVLEHCRKIETREKLSAIMLDLTIPGSLGGKEIIGELRERFSDLPIFASSGYSQDDVMANPQNYGFTESIAKPFERGELVRLLSTYAVE